MHPIKIELVSSKPLIWRRVIIPADIQQFLRARMLVRLRVWAGFQVMRSFFVSGMILSIPSMKKCVNGEKANTIGRLTLLLEIACLRLA